MKKVLIILGLILFTVAVKAQNNGYVSKVTDYIILQGDTIRLNVGTLADGQVLKRVSGVWTNAEGAAGTASIDSLKWNAATGYLSWYIGGSVSDSISLDDRYVKLEDSTVVYVTPTQLEEATSSANVITQTISLPAGNSVGERIAAAIPGTDYPTGWTLSVGVPATDIIIEHDLGRYVFDISIVSNPSGTERRQLRYSDAHGGWLCPDDNTLTIQSLAVVSTRIYINIIFTE